MTESFFQSSKGNARFVVPRPLKIGIHCIVLTLLAVFGLTASTCERVTGPDGIIQRDWKILYRDRDRTIARFYILSTKEKRFVDSIVVPYSGELVDAALSADGSKLFITGSNGGFEILEYSYPGLHLVDTVEQGARYSFRYVMSLAPSPAGGSFLLGTISTDTASPFQILLVNEESLQTECAFPENAQAAYFSTHGSTIVTRDVTGLLRTRRLLNPSRIVDSIRPFDGDRVSVCCTDAGDRLFTYSDIAFTAYNLINNSIEFQFSLPGGGQGNMRITPSEEFIIFSSPGSFMSAGDDSLRIYNIVENRLDTTIYTLGHITGTNHYATLSRFFISPDGAWLYSDPGDLFQGDHCLLFNLIERRIDSTIYLYGAGNEINVVQFPYLD